MNIDRSKIIEKLEHTRKCVVDPVLVIAEDQRSDLNEALDKCVHYAKYGRYHVTTLGVFSTGKSTLLNAMLEDRLLPAADVPVTAITTEIYYSEQTSIFIPMENVTEEILADFKHGIDALGSQTKVDVIDSLQRDGETVAGVGGTLDVHDSALLYKILDELTSQQRRNQEPFARLKGELDSNHDLTLWLGISILPDWLRDIVLTDAPGTGSIDDSHEIVINKIIPESQLVLYVIESAKAGSAIDKRFCDRVSNTYHRKIFYVLNKIDQQNNDERADALDQAKRCMPDVVADGEKPEFLNVAGLYALIANELGAGKISINEVLNDRKINLNLLLVNPAWMKSDEAAKKKLLVEFLLQTSNFKPLRARIEEYLKFENKDIAISQHANATIADVASIIVHGCDNSLRVLNSDSTLEELRKKKDDAHDLRCKYKEEADAIIRDYQCSVLDRNMGLGAAITGLLSPVPDEIACRLKETLQDAESYRTLQKKEGLQKWLKKELQDCIADVVRKIDNDLNKRYAHLLEQLSPILKKIEDGSLANTLSSIQVQEEISADATNAPRVAASAAAGAVALGAGAWALTALGVGVSTVVTGTGLAGTLAGWGFTTLSTWSAGISLGTVGTSTTFFGLSAAGFFIPVVGVGIAAGTIIALCVFGKKWKIDTMVSKTKEQLEKIVLRGGIIEKEEIVPVAVKMRNLVEEAIQSSKENITKKIENRLRQMDEEENKLLEEFEKASEIKKKKINKIEQLRNDVTRMGADAQRALKKVAEGL